MYPADPVILLVFLVGTIIRKSGCFSELVLFPKNWYFSDGKMTIPGRKWQSVFFPVNPGNFLTGNRNF